MDKNSSAPGSVIQRYLFLDTSKLRPRNREDAINGLADINNQRMQTDEFAEC